MAKEVAYTVRGTWPFPVDMLRYDASKAAAPADQVLIDRLSLENVISLGDLRHPMSINLVGSNKPNTARWESFGWSVPADEMHAFSKELKAEKAARDAAYATAMAKLTPAEKAAVNWNGRAA